MNLKQMCKEKTICKIRYLQNYSESFEINFDQYQKETLSPTLFNLNLENNVRDMNEQQK